MIKHSVRYFLNKKVRAVRDNKANAWWYSSYDIISILTESSNPRIYWNALKRRHPELLAFCRQLKLFADDGKRYLSDVINEKGINKLRYVIHSSKSQNFNKWINGGLDPIDEQKQKKSIRTLQD